MRKPYRTMVLVGVAWATLGALPVQGAEPAVELIQSVSNKTLGELKMPGFWEVTELADGVRAVESRSIHPAAIEVATLELPVMVPASWFADAVKLELSEAGSLENLKESKREQLGDVEPKVDQLYFELRGTEAGLEVAYGVVIVTGTNRALVATLGAPSDRFEAFGAKALLLEILGSVRAK